jgi:hypothetical protein
VDYNHSWKSLKTPISSLIHLEIIYYGRLLILSMFLYFDVISNRKEALLIPRKISGNKAPIVLKVLFWNFLNRVTMLYYTVIVSVGVGIVIVNRLEVIVNILSGIKEHLGMKLSKWMSNRFTLIFKISI